MKLFNVETGEVLLNNLKIADSFWQRFWGLQFQSTLPPDSGLLLSPCSSLHTCFMRFSIDVIMLGQGNVVIGVKRGLVPWRAFLCDRGTLRVIEVSHGNADVEIGAPLDWCD